MKLHRYLARLTLAACLLASAAAASATASEGPQMARVLDAVNQRDYPLARTLADALRNPVARDLVIWHQLRDGGGDWAAYSDFLTRNPDWPGLAFLRKQAERTMPPDLATASVRAFFAGHRPQTGQGAMMLARALGGLEAQAVIVNAWTHLSLTAPEREAFVRDFGKMIAPYHPARADEMLWSSRPEQAEAMLGYLSAADAALVRARIALQRDENGVDALISAIPAARSGDPGLAHDRFAWRMRKDRYDDSEELLAQRSVSSKALGRPEAWSYRRRLLAHRAMREGRDRLAYNLASQHFLTSGSDYAALEWLSGYIALTELKDADRAVRHFERFRLAVATPISLGRAGYWLGRAYEAAGNTAAARSAYGFGAAYQTSFYGQLSVERAGLPVDVQMAANPALPDWKSRAFAASTPIQAALLLREAGDHQLMQRFILHVQESLAPDDSAALAGMALDLQRPFAALKIAKRVAETGVILPAAYYPVTELASQRLAARAEVVKAIARQESELNPFAISPAGARGLMQLMPGTAQKVARDLTLPYDLARLTADPAYNALLGSTYLAEMLARYDGSVLLAAAAYNAGPNRVDAWIAAHGDPRDPSVDAIWWIENIPYSETRNYVMRVLESLHVYRMRIGGKVTPIGLASELGLSR